MNPAQLIEARNLAAVYGQSISALDTTPAITVQYSPALGAGGASSTRVGKMKITSDGFRFKVDDDTPSGNDVLTNMTSSGWLTYASQTNMGLMRDNLNGSIAWRCILRASLRGDIASNLLDATETVVSNDAGKVFFWDSKVETLVAAGLVISGERFVNNGRAGHVTDADDEVENSLLFLEVNHVDSDLTLTFYSATQSAETTIGPTTAFTAAGTATYFGNNDPDDVYITATRGERLIARVTVLTEAIATPTRFHALGKSAILKNDRFVKTGTEVN